MADDVVEVCRWYDEIVSRLMPGRELFFPNSNGNLYTKEWLEKTFRIAKAKMCIRDRVSTNQNSAVSKPQNAVSYFPEFNYKTYWRLLERMGSGQFEFQKNHYSTYKNRTHFSPIWMPNGAYEVNTWAVSYTHLDVYKRQVILYRSLLPTIRSKA